MAEDLIFPITLSGVRPGETDSVIAMIAAAGLPSQDLDADKLTHFLVARSGDAIVGAVGLEPVGEQALLRSLVVPESYRHRSIAKRLMAAIEKYARSHGTETIYLLTLGAGDLFVKLGYKPIEHQALPAGIQATEELCRLCPAKARCFSKRLLKCST